jgi:hypothetical protein
MTRDYGDNRLEIFDLMSKELETASSILSEECIDSACNKWGNYLVHEYLAYKTLSDKYWPDFENQYNCNKTISDYQKEYSEEYDEYISTQQPKKFPIDFFD